MYASTAVLGFLCFCFFWVLGFWGFRVLGFGVFAFLSFRVCGFWFVLSLEFRVWGLGFMERS